VINYNELLKNMKDAVEYLKQDYTNNLNLRVAPSSFEQLAVKTPSGQVKLGEIAQVEVKSAQMYLIDLIKTPDYVKPVLDAITKSKLHPNPQLDKTSIYLSIGRITREHREQMTKTAKLKCEQAIKKIKEAESKALRRAKEAKNVSSDLIFNVSQHVSSKMILILH
jgi:ribosome recycling factor